MEEAANAIADETFAVLNDQPRYVGIDAARLEAHARHCLPYRDAVLTSGDLAIKVTEARSATAAQWDFMQRLSAIMPTAEVVLRAHHVSWKGHPDAPILTAFGVRLTCTIGPFIVKREFAAPDA
jgi:hypothetical protein